MIIFPPSYFSLLLENIAELSKVPPSLLHRQNGSDGTEKEKCSTNRRGSWYYTMNLKRLSPERDIYGVKIEHRKTEKKNLLKISERHCLWHTPGC